MDGQQPEPFCLECGYDVSGLPGSRCPECGTAFDLVEVRASLRRWSMTMPQILVRLMAAPGALLAFLLVVMLAASMGDRGRVAQNVMQWFGWLVVWGSLIGSLFASVQVARGLCWNRAIRRRRSPYYRHNMLFMGLVVPGLWCVQVFLAVSGCFCAVMSVA